MARVEKVSVALTPEMAGLVRQAVEAGEYASAGDLMREALQDWQQRRAERQDALQEVGRLWDEGLASGPSIDGEAAFEEIRIMLDERLSRTPRP
ncbi:MAG: type II toxin-antitoxin system ParD family antitoxin [Tistrella sp.]|uniref:Type II toxin-antitoxin system ParD family antitoxin n=1 Tax=Tistrella mobilis TaxID=171437 RepID=A0A3B9ITD2_9PROT|nr:type II toxin-antitoxin system ParD family antitoxin [Tistrella sp.]MAD40476.1 type II toxin-antitoxin system ParD family antitoxin [Tistrella sp.]MBA76855.1 type II toxin-antitoxin system ParD family antitoxin [Tistrella sp.]HAE51142.1 type II toxin-antitoxin system ParD family antitoxin [Tistrella mobilis]